MNNFKEVKDLIQEIENECKPKIGKLYIFRGVSCNYDPENDRLSSQLYRKWKELQNINPRQSNPSLDWSLAELEAVMLRGAKKYYANGTANYEILTDIQHFGGLTNLIDFTYNLHIALFFACNENFDDNGELFILSVHGNNIYSNQNVVQILQGDIKTDDLESFDSNNQLGSVQALRMFNAPINQRSQNRVITQQSAFVHAKGGYIHIGTSKQDHISCMSVPASLKRDVLLYIKKYYGIDANSIYNDIHGQMQNYSKLMHELKSGTKSRLKGNFKQAAKCFSQIIALNPNHKKVWYQLGDMHIQLAKQAESKEECRERYKDALGCFEQITKCLDDTYTTAWFQLGYVHTKLARQAAKIGQQVERKEHYEEARNCLEKVTGYLNTKGLDEEHIGAWHLLSLVYGYLGKRKDIQRCHEKIKELRARQV